LLLEKIVMKRVFGCVKLGWSFDEDLVKFDLGGQVILDEINRILFSLTGLQDFLPL
jgi:hypothetical protein